MSARRLLPLLAFLGSWVDALSAEVRDESWNIKADVQIVAIPMNQSLKLVPQLRDAERGDAAMNELQRLIEDDLVNLLDWPTCMFVPGKPVTSAHVEEIRYPVREDFSHPAFRRWMPLPAGMELLPRPPWGAIVPTAFQTRDTGCKIEIDGARVSNGGQMIELQVVIDYSRFLSHKQWRGAKSPLEIEGLVVAPDFQLSRLTTRVAAPNGRRILIGMGIEKQPAERAILFLLRVTAAAFGSPQKQ